MNKQYFFAMSNGSYSDYRVGGFYISDHPITEEEWHDFARKQSEVIFAKHQKVDWEDENAESWLAFQEWRQHNTAEKLFVKLHNLTPVEYTELWYDFD